MCCQQMTGNPDRGLAKTIELGLMPVNVSV